MKFLSIPTVAAGMVLATLLAATGHAQYMKSELVLGAGAGLQFPTGAFGEAVDGDHSLYMTADYVLNPSWSLGIRAAYETFDGPETVTATSLRRIRYLSGDVQARLFLYPESWFTPYTVAGFGMFRERAWTGAGAQEQTADRSRAGLLGGFGLSAHRQGERLSVFTEVLYHHLVTSETRQWVQWSAGLRFSFGGRPF
jgi:hypothetical protein